MATRHPVITSAKAGARASLVLFGSALIQFTTKQNVTGVVWTTICPAYEMAWKSATVGESATQSPLPPLAYPTVSSGKNRLVSWMRLNSVSVARLVKNLPGKRALVVRHEIVGAAGQGHLIIERWSWWTEGMA